MSEKKRKLSESTDAVNVGHANTSGVENVGFRRPEALQSVSRDNPFYNIRDNKRGFAIIFKQETFDTSTGLEDRACATEDANKCRDTFGALNFYVKEYSDLLKDEFEETLDNIRNNRVPDMQLESCDCMIIIFMGHGSEDLDENKQKQEYIMLHDKKALTNTLWKSFTADKCPQLAGKPKLFFIQACRGKTTDKGITLKKRRWASDFMEDDYVIPLHADMLMMWASYPGMYAFRVLRPRDGINGSVFIHFLCQVLRRDYEREDLSSMLLSVTRDVAVRYEALMHDNPELHKSKQTPYIVSTLMRKIVFGEKARRLHALISKNPDTDGLISTLSDLNNAQE